MSVRQIASFTVVSEPLCRRVRRAYLGACFASVAFAAGTAVPVPAATHGPTETAAPSAEAALRQQLRESYPQVSDWVIRPLGKAEVSGTANGDVLVRVLGARSRVDVEGRSQWFDVSGAVEAVTLARTVRSGEAIAEHDLITRSSDVFAVRCDRPFTPDMLRLPAEIVVAKRSGAVLCEGDVRALAAVAARSTVAVRVVRGAVTLSTRGVASRRGEIGERIEVTLAENGTAVWGRVVGLAEVLIDE